jgi:6-phosphogluconolactonase
MLNLILYVAAAGGTNSGIHTLSYNPANETLRSVAFTALPGAGYLVFSADRTSLYAAVSQSATFAGDGEVAAFAVAPDGSLKYLNSLPSGGLSCCHLTLGGRYLYCANYSGGTVGEFKLAADGSLERRTQLLRHEGKGAHPTRQTSAHPHFTQLTPDGRFLAVVDLGCDGVFFYPLDPVAGIPATPSGFSASTPGDGPRHLVFDATGSVAYVANELGNSVSVCGYTNGALTLRQTVPTLPSGFSAPSSVAAIRLSPDGRRLYCSNRGHDSVAEFDVGSDGALAPDGHIPAGGNGPRDFILFPDTEWMAVANEKSDNVVILARSSQDGNTYRTAASLSIASRPICVLYSPASAD